MNKNLKCELTVLIGHVDRLRQEIAVMAQGRFNDKTSFQYISSQLTEIMATTELASNTIMEAGENILGISDQLQGELSDDELIKFRDKISAGAIESIQACSFQDNAGQRISKILSTLKFIEDCLGSIITVCGSDAMKEMINTLPDPEIDIKEVEMAGPAMAGEGISQDEVDALFG